MARLVFMGTPDFAVPALAALLTTAHEIVAVYTQAPKPKGRGHQVQPSPVQALAAAHNLTVLTPPTLRTPEAQAQFASLQADLAIVAAYGLILPQAVLDAPARGCLNLHGSLLPRWRGAAPIQRAIEAGDTQTAICLMGMEAGLDTGPVFAHTLLPITAVTTSATLAAEMAHAGAALLLQHLPALLAGTAPSTPQPEGGLTYAKKIDKAEARIDWQQPAAVLERRLRAFTPWPLLEFVHNGESIKLLQAELAPGHSPAGTVLGSTGIIACGQGALKLLRVQRAGKGPVSGAEWLRAIGLASGTVLA